MKKVLYIDCCIRGELSRTKKLAEAFFNHLKPEYTVTHLELPKLNLQYFSGDYFAEREELLENGDLSHPRFSYAKQFAEADLIVIAAPFWDLSFPALLKVYVEQVSVDGITFRTSAAGLEGICKAKQMVYLTTRGGFYTDDEMEMGSRYLEAMSRFFGIGQYTCIAADGMDVEGFAADRSLITAQGKAAMLAWSL